jgi:hypothetical protein
MTTKPNKSYFKPDKTYQDKLTNQEIKDKLKDYKKTIDIKTVPIGTHIRYFSIDPKTKEKLFRMGGNLNKIDPEGRFIILSNGNITWSVQIPNAIFYQKMSETEFKDELKKEVKKEMMSEVIPSDNENENLKKEIKNLNKKLDYYKELEKDYKIIIKKNETLIEQILQIESEIKKKKLKNKK